MKKISSRTSETLIKIFVPIGMVVAAIGIALGMWWLVMHLWNWLIPSLFHGPHITLWQAGGLLVLIAIVGRAFRTRSNKDE